MQVNKHKKEIIMTNPAEFAIDAEVSDIWVVRAQSLFNAFKKHIPEVEAVTVGRVLEVYCDKRLSNRDRTDMLEVFHAIPGFRQNSIDDGLFHYIFVGQLEYMCGGLKLADARGLICK